MKIFKILLPLAAAGLLIGIYVFLNSLHYERTDDAEIAADVTQVSAKVSGQILQVLVNDNQEVSQGDLLAVIDPRDYRARWQEALAAWQNARSAQNAAKIKVGLTQASAQADILQAQAYLSQTRQARASLRAAQANADLAAATLRRDQALYARDEVSRQDLDQALAGARSARANVQALENNLAAAFLNFRQARSRLVEAAPPEEGRRPINVVQGQINTSKAQRRAASASVKQALAALEAARLNLSYTKISAPVSGRIADKTVESGNYTQAGQILLSIVPKQVWVVADFKETQLTYMKPGQRAEIKVDAYPGKAFRGHVDGIQAGTGAVFSLLPPENATGNYVKVVQRIPVKIVFDEPIDPRYELSPGMSVVPRVKVR